MQNRIIFFHPKKLVQQSTRPSEIRPIRILSEFRSQGYQVDVVAGSSKERQICQKAVLKNITSGIKYSFLYGETSNKPNALSDPDSILRKPLSDLLFLKAVKKAQIPIGIFYRDIYWKFPLFKELLPWYQRYLSLPFYWFDWFVYKSVTDHFFLPSSEMNQYLPHPMPPEKESELPPGVDPEDEDSIKPIFSKETLRCLYVGGINPPLYDLRSVLKEISSTNNIELTICCRKADWDLYKHLYNNELTPNIKIKHLSGDDLKKIYRCSDIALIVREPHTYLDFCMPFKLFESINYELPLITSGHNSTSRFIDTYNIGWTIGSTQDLSKILKKIRDDPTLLQNKIRNIKSCKHKSTWAERIKRIERNLIKS